MNLYEVARWGNTADDPFFGGPDGADTCFLVRAGSVEEAAALADAELSRMAGCAMPGNGAAVVHLLGIEQSTDATPRILRGPYLQHAYRHGWRHWSREEPDAGWVEGT